MTLSERLRAKAEAVLSVARLGMDDGAGETLGSAAADMRRAADELDRANPASTSAKEALQFYRDEWRPYCGDHGVPIGGEPSKALLDDQGDRARTALEAVPDTGDEPMPGCPMCGFDGTDAGSAEDWHRRNLPVAIKIVREALVRERDGERTWNTMPALLAAVDACPMFPMPEMAGKSGKASLSSDQLAAIILAALGALEQSHA